MQESVKASTMENNGSAAAVSLDPATVVLHRNKNGELVRRKGEKTLHEYLKFKSTEFKSRPYRTVLGKAHVASFPLLLDKRWKDYDRLTEREPAIKRVKKALPGYSHDLCELILVHKCRDDGKNGRRRKLQKAQKAQLSAITDAPGNTDTSRDGQAMEGPPPPPETFPFVDELGIAPTYKDHMKLLPGLNYESFPYTMPSTYPGPHVSAPNQFLNLQSATTMTSDMALPVTEFATSTPELQFSWQQPTGVNAAPMPLQPLDYTPVNVITTPPDPPVYHRSQDPIESVIDFHQNWRMNPSMSMQTYLTIMETEGKRLYDSGYITPKMVKLTILRGLNCIDEYRQLVAQLEQQIHSNANIPLDALKARLMQAETQHRHPASERY